MASHAYGELQRVRRKLGKMQVRIFEFTVYYDTDLRKVLGQNTIPKTDMSYDGDSLGFKSIEEPWGRFPDGLNYKLPIDDIWLEVGRRAASAKQWTIVINPMEKSCRLYHFDSSRESKSMTKSIDKAMSILGYKLSP